MSCMHAYHEHNWLAPVCWHPLLSPHALTPYSAGPHLTPWGACGEYYNGAMAIPAHRADVTGKFGTVSIELKLP